MGIGSSTCGPVLEYLRRGGGDPIIHLRNKWIDYARTGGDLKAVLHVLRVDCLTALADGHRDGGYPNAKGYIAQKSGKLSPRPDDRCSPCRNRS